MSIKILHERQPSSKEDKKRLFLDELRHSKSSGKLKEQQNPFSIKVPDIRQGDDHLGCAIACYRMASAAQGNQDIGQILAREILSPEFIPTPNGEAEVSPEAANKFGIRGGFYVGLHPTTEEKKWPTKMLDLILQQYIMIAAFKMADLFDNGSQDRHAVVINGVEYKNDKLHFLINDPLTGKKEITDERLIAAALDEPFIVAIPTKKELWVEKSNEVIKISRPTKIIKIEKKPRIRILN